MTFKLPAALLLALLIIVLISVQAKADEVTGRLTVNGNTSTTTTIQSSGINITNSGGGSLGNSTTAKNSTTNAVTANTASTVPITIKPLVAPSNSTTTNPGNALTNPVKSTGVKAATSTTISQQIINNLAIIGLSMALVVSIFLLILSRSKRTKQ